MNKTNYSVYTRNPVPNIPEFNQIKSINRKKSSRIADESASAKSVRRRLYGKDEAQSGRTKHLSLAQRQKLARDQVLEMLMDPQIVDPAKITDILCDWAKNDLGIDESVSNRIFSNALVTTESVPSKSMFKIRVKI